MTDLPRVTPSKRQAVSFLEKLQEVKAARDKHEQEIEELRANFKRVASGGLIEPGTKRKWSRGGRPKLAHHTTGKGAGFKSNRREKGAPVRRRDPTAREKIHMIQAIEKQMRIQEVTQLEMLTAASKREWEDPLINQVTKLNSGFPIN